MTKESLIAMGLTEEQAGKVMAGLDGDFVPKSRFNEVNQELKTARETVKARDTQLEELKKATGDTEALQKKITELQTANTAQKEAHKAELLELRKGNALEAALTKANAINATAVKPFLHDFMQNAKLMEDGSVEGLAGELEKLTKGKDTGFLFRSAGGSGGISGAHPAGTPATPPGAKEPKDMSYDELTAYLAGGGKL